jgi:tetratricopeptide (TPR) repeat protein
MARSAAFGPRKSPYTSFFQLLVAACCLGLLAVSARAKEAPPIIAIALFDSPNGQAYVQINGLMLNSKTELRVCDGVPKFDKKTYDKLPKTQLQGATSLERGQDGVLILASASGSVCVVPSGLKFDKNAEFTTSEAADQALLQGAVIGASAKQSSDLPALKPGVRLVFVPAPDTELAEYLRAERTHTVAGWREFLVRYDSSPHAGEAKKNLAALFEEAGESAFDEYQKSVTAHRPDLTHLKRAHGQAEQAIHTLEGHPPALKLIAQIRGQLDKLIESDRAELRAYRKALAEHTPGYAHLAAAKKHNDLVVDASPKYKPALDLQTDLFEETRKFEADVQNAETLLASKRYDEALNAIESYRAFEAEAPRIQTIVTVAYSYHFNRGQELSAQPDWEKAVAEFRKAVGIRTDNKEAAAALKNAETQLTDTRNRQAAGRALQQSKGYAENNQPIEAYEVLAELPEAQRSLVSSEMAALQASYTSAAVQRAQKLQQVHLPIRGRADEDAVREAYGLLARAGSLGDDPSIRLKLELLSDKISSYYMDQAKRYLEKPLASGVGLGWLYLGEAQHYKPNLETVKDEMTRYAPAYQLRARLSIGVVFRDQSSRRENAGFADQLADAIATSLETSGLVVKVIRQAAENPSNVQPGFMLVGEVLQHRLVKNPTLETLPSKYRVGTREVKNEAWATANRDYEAAQQQLTAAQHALTDAQAHNKKKEIAAASDAVAAAQKEADQKRAKRDSMESTRPQDVVEAYNYTKKTIDLSAVIELAFRVTDQAGSLVEPASPIQVENHKNYVLVENVKPEDTEGVKQQGAAPDDNQFVTDLEIKARDVLIKSVREKVLHLPEKILAEARKRVQQNDAEGAAEQYILYLNAAPESPVAERTEAIGFLRDHFNVAPATGTQSPTQSQLR